MLYTVPDFQNPTGVTLSLARRRRLIELANAYGLLVVEDTPYRALRYEGESLPTLKSLDTEGRVLHLGSFSKILAPALRLGWAVASPEILERLDAAEARRRHAEQHAQHDRDVGLPQPLRHRSPHRSGDPGLPPQARPDAGNDGGDVPGRRALHEARRRPLRLADPPAGLDAAAFMAETMLPEAKVAYVPGATFFPVDQEPNHARLSFSGVPDDRLVHGITELGRLLRRQGL